MGTTLLFLICLTLWFTALALTAGAWDPVNVSQRQIHSVGGVWEEQALAPTGNVHLSGRQVADLSSLTSGSVAAATLPIVVRPVDETGATVSSLYVDEKMYLEISISHRMLGAEGSVIVELPDALSLDDFFEWSCGTALLKVDRQQSLFIITADATAAVESVCTVVVIPTARTDMLPPLAATVVVRVPEVPAPQSHHFALPPVRGVMVSVEHSGSIPLKTISYLSLSVLGRTVAPGDTLTLRLPYTVEAPASAGTHCVAAETQEIIATMSLSDASIVPQASVLSPTYALTFTFHAPHADRTTAMRCVFPIVATELSTITEATATITEATHALASTATSSTRRSESVLVSVDIPSVRAVTPSVSVYNVLPDTPAPYVQEPSTVFISLTELTLAPLLDSLVIRTPLQLQVLPADPADDFHDVSCFSTVTFTDVVARVRVRKRSLTLSVDTELVATTTVICAVTVTPTTSTIDTSVSATLNGATIAATGVLYAQPLFRLDSTLAAVGAPGQLTVSIKKAAGYNDLALGDAYSLQLPYSVMLMENYFTTATCLHPDTYTPVGTLAVTEVPRRYTLVITAPPTNDLVCTLIAVPTEPSALVNVASMAYTPAGADVTVALAGQVMMPLIALLYAEFYLSSAFVPGAMVLALRFINAGDTFVFHSPVPLSVAGMRQVGDNAKCQLTDKGTTYDVAKVTQLGAQDYSFTTLMESYSTLLGCSLLVTPLAPTPDSPESAGIIFGDITIGVTNFPAIPLVPFFLPSVDAPTVGIPGSFVLYFSAAMPLSLGQAYTLTPPYAYQPFQGGCANYTGTPVALLAYDGVTVTITLIASVAASDALTCAATVVPTAAAAAGLAAVYLDSVAVDAFMVPFPAVNVPSYSVQLLHTKLDATAVAQVTVLHRAVKANDAITVDNFYASSTVANSFTPPWGTELPPGVFSVCLSAESDVLALATIIDPLARLTLIFMKDIPAGQISCGVPFRVTSNAGANAAARSANVYYHSTADIGEPVATTTIPAIGDRGGPSLLAMYQDLLRVRQVGYLYVDIAALQMQATTGCTLLPRDNPACNTLVLPLPSPVHVVYEYCLNLNYDANLTPIAFASATGPAHTLYPTSSLTLRFNNTALMQEAKCIVAVFASSPSPAPAFNPAPVLYQGNPIAGASVVQSLPVLPNYYLTVTSDDIGKPDSHVTLTITLAAEPRARNVRVDVPLAAARFSSMLGCSGANRGVAAAYDYLHQHLTLTVSELGRQEAVIECIFRATRAQFPTRTIAATLSVADASVATASFTTVPLQPVTVDVPQQQLTLVRSSYLSPDEQLRLRSAYASVAGASVEHVVLLSQVLHTATPLAAQQPNPDATFVAPATALNTSDSRYFAHIHTPMGLLPIPRTQEVLHRVAASQPLTMRNTALRTVALATVSSLEVVLAVQVDNATVDDTAVVAAVASALGLAPSAVQVAPLLTQPAPVECLDADVGTCGGSCAPCALGKRCLDHDDCASGLCGLSSTSNEGAVCVDARGNSAPDRTSFVLPVAVVAALAVLMF